MGKISYTQQLKKDIRGRLIVKYGKVCFYCADKLEDVEITLDHFIPLSAGGANQIENMVISCSKCNLDKKALMPEEYLAILKVRRNALFRKIRNMTDTIKSLDTYIRLK